MPNRLIKESIHTSEKLNQLTDFQFRVWVNLLTYVDDYGRGDARPAVIKGTCFPLRDRITAKSITKALQELEEMDIVTISSADEHPILIINRWTEMYPETGRHTNEYREWRKNVFKRDDYTCQICGKRGGKLNAHHIIRYRNSVENRTNIDNGITLCESCHKAVHRKEGK